MLEKQRSNAKGLQQYYLFYRFLYMFALTEEERLTVATYYAYSVMMEDAYKELIADTNDQECKEAAGRRMEKKGSGNKGA